MTSEQFIDGALTLIVGALAFYLWWRGGVERFLSQRGYIFVAAGMTLVVMGLLLNLADDFPAVSNYVFAVDNPFADNLRWYGGYVLGGLFILIGFTQRVPIVQGGLNNVARHAQTSEATLGLWVTDGVLRVQVEDHGVGFQRRDRPLHDGECRPTRNARTHRGAQGDADRQLYTWRGFVLRVELPLDTT